LSGSRFLLDTSILIWWLAEPERLNPTISATIANPDLQICCSVVNLWEIQIKSHLGKLDMSLPLPQIHAWIVEHEGWELLPVRWPHVRQLDGLPWVHKDPFDRLLIAQALEERLTLVSADQLIRRYPVPFLG
jgi:PIN domain nuclease of toxin-antitoxin system